MKKQGEDTIYSMGSICRKPGIHSHSFGEAADEWLDMKRDSIRDSSYALYSFYVEKHLLPTFGGRLLNEITEEELRDFFREKREHGRFRDNGSLSDKTIRDLETVMKQIFSYAEKNGLTDQVPNFPPAPCRQPGIRILTGNEQKKLERTAIGENSSFSTSVLLVLYSGLRGGEICGLRWGDIDFDERTLSVSRTVMRISEDMADADPTLPRTKVVIGDPKTESSKRILPLQEDMSRYLWVRRRPADCYIATGTTTCLEPRQFRFKFKTLLKHAGVEHCTVHALRHTFATRCIENGVDIKSLSEIMGHSNVQITMQRYVHPSMETKRAQINKLACHVTDHWYY